MLRLVIRYKKTAFFFLCILIQLSRYKFFYCSLCLTWISFSTCFVLVFLQAHAVFWCLIKYRLTKNILGMNNWAKNYKGNIWEIIWYARVQQISTNLWAPSFHGDISAYISWRIHPEGAPTTIVQAFFG